MTPEMRGVKSKGEKPPLAFLRHGAIILYSLLIINTSHDMWCNTDEKAERMKECKRSDEVWLQSVLCVAGQTTSFKNVKNKRST